MYFPHVLRCDAMCFSRRKLNFWVPLILLLFSLTKFLRENLKRRRHEETIYDVRPVSSSFLSFISNCTLFTTLFCRKMANFPLVSKEMVLSFWRKGMLRALLHQHILMRGEELLLLLLYIKDVGLGILMTIRILLERKIYLVLSFPFDTIQKELVLYVALK